MKTFSVLALAVATLGLAACDASAPAEESPVAPSVVCDQPTATVLESGVDLPANDTCAVYSPVITNEAVADGNVN